jgi:anti-sigma regulatory factor (Ser/Thr protein kinase)
VPQRRFEVRDRESRLPHGSARNGGSSVASDAVVSVAAPAVASTVPEMRRLLVAFAERLGAEEAVLHDVARAVTEAVTNVVLHAYEPGAPGLVHVVADVEGDALEVLVIDHGRGLRPGQSEGLGVGLSSIAASTAHFSISSREPSGTEVWMRFLLAR